MATSRSSSKPLSVLKTADAGFEASFEQLCERRVEDDATLDRDARRIIERVRAGGDAELLTSVKKLHGASLGAIEVEREEWEEACESADGADRAALGKAAMRIREYHRKRIPSSWEVREEGGAFLGLRVRPLDRVGIHLSSQLAEGGVCRPTDVIMAATPASVVEVPEIVLASPPRRDGSIAPELLIAAKVSGVHRVFKMGGAPAIAAMAFGTESVPRVDKIVGGGGPLATAAKRILAQHVGTTGDDGRGELIVIADRSATPSWLAADLLSEAEHAASGGVLLLTHSKPLVTRVQDQIARQLKGMASAKSVRKRLCERGVVVVTRNLDESITLTNRYAPEKVLLAIENPEGAAKQVVNAGTILLGHYTPLVMGGTLAGPNQLLPTGGSARFSSPLAVEDFLKRTSFAKFEAPKLRELGVDAMRLAGVEGSEAGTHAVDLRLQKIRRARREREAAREAEIEI